MAPMINTVSGPAPRTPVESSAIVSAGYVESAALLDVEFRSGGLYRYFGVPRQVFDAFSAAKSKGSFINHEVKPRFPCRRL